MAIRRFPRLPNCKRCIGPRMGGDLGLCWLARFQLLRGTHLDGQADCVQHGAGDRQEQHVHVHHPALLAGYDDQLCQVQARPCAPTAHIKKTSVFMQGRDWMQLVKTPSRGRRSRIKLTQTDLCLQDLNRGSVLSSNENCGMCQGTPISNVETSACMMMLIVAMLPKQLECMETKARGGPDRFRWGLEPCSAAARALHRRSDRLRHGPAQTGRTHLTPIEACLCTLSTRQGQPT